MIANNKRFYHANEAKVQGKEMQFSEINHQQPVAQIERRELRTWNQFKANGQGRKWQTQLSD
jgi:hypothetical protein